MVLGAAALAVVLAGAFAVWFVTGVRDVRDRDLILDPGYASTGDCLLALLTVPCRQTHDGEVYAEHIVPLAISDFEEVDGWVADRCIHDFVDYVGRVPQESAFSWIWLWGGEERFKRGDRQVLCLVQAADPFDGTMQDARR